jgi:hypothetical protein
LGASGIQKLLKRLYAPFGQRLVTSSCAAGASIPAREKLPSATSEKNQFKRVQI